MTKLLTTVIFLATIMLFLSSCEYKYIVEPIPPPPPPGDTTSFSLEIIPIWDEQGCTACHNKGGQAPDYTSPDVYNIITDMGLVVAKDPDASIIYYYPLPSGSHFVKYTSAQALLVKYWIDEGAKNN